MDVGAADSVVPADRYWRLRHLPPLLAASAALIALAALVGGLTVGTAGALGAAIGVAVVTFSYTSSTLVVAWADSLDPQLVLPFGLAMYVAKFSVFGVLMAAAAATGWPGLVPLALGLSVAVAVWTGVHIWWISTVHLRRLAETTSA
ncbi:hypothetical protein [Micromonospora pisi]|uniref:hypothetical protein n=1 Tax=Micromonospora pisi TaxID=589240 RepID=UPI000EAC31B9|nr:hypothetical protein [Micromonospora pisi]